MAASWLPDVTGASARFATHVLFTLSLTRAHRKDSPVPPRARHFIEFHLSRSRFHDIVRGSLLLQYACRTELAGVMAYAIRYTISHDAPSSTVWSRSGVGKRRGVIWEDIYLLLPLPGSSYPQRWTYSALSSSAMIICLQSTGRAIRQVCASLHSYTSISARRFVQANTNGKTDYPKDSIAITLAFSIEEDDLVVSVLRSAPYSLSTRFALTTSLNVVFVFLWLLLFFF